MVDIGDAAFHECKELNKINFPHSINSIGKLSFYNCVGLEKLVIPENVKSIGRKAFYGCNSLIIEVSNSTITRDDTFEGCKSIYRY